MLKQCMLVHIECDSGRWISIYARLITKQLKFANSMGQIGSFSGGTATHITYMANYTKHLSKSPCIDTSV